MTQAAQALSTALLHFLWQGIIVGVSLGIALTVLRKSSAAARYAVCCAALVVLALAPVITGFAVYTAANPVAAVVTPATPDPAVAATTISESVRRSVVQDPQRWILPLWVAGVLVFALRFVWAGGYAYALRRKGVEADGSLQVVVAALCERLEIRRRVRVIVSSIAEVPSTLGWLRPVILLPSAVLLGITPQQLEALIAHELAHVRRCDYFVNILQMVVETFLFYHPAVWWISSRVRYERELCCDDLAVRLSGDAVTYARALAQIEKLRPAEGIVMGSANGPVFHRIQRLLGIHSIEHGPSKFACALGLLAGMLCLGFFMNTARAEQDPPRLPPNTEVDEALQNLETVIQQLHGLTSVVPPVPPLPPALSPEAVLPALSAVEAPPAAPLPPSPPELLVSAAAPVPQLAPAPPLPPVGRLLHTVSAESSHWVLFSGTDLILHGDATDEADARKARQSLNGDLLWFRFEGKAYVTQDKEILDRILASNASQVELARSFRAEQDKLLAENFEIQKKLAEAKKTLLDLNRTNQSLELEAVAKKLAEARNMPNNDNQNLLLDLQRRLEMASIDAGKAQIEKESELELVMKNMLALQRLLKGLEAQRMVRDETHASRDVDILRDAVRSGKAQTAP